MSKADGIISTTLRLDTNTPEGWKAYAFLHTSRKEKKCRSYSELITDLLCACYDREMQKQRDPYLETREKEDAFVNWIKETITDNPKAQSLQRCLDRIEKDYTRKIITEKDKDLLNKTVRDMYHRAVTQSGISNEDFEKSLATNVLYPKCGVIRKTKRRGRPKS